MLAVKDNLASYKIAKETLFDLPFRLLLSGKSLIAGKSTVILNLLLRPFDGTDKDGAEFYKNDFEGKNIYIVNPSLHYDEKFATLIKAKAIPDANVFTEFNEEEMTELYNRLAENYEDEKATGKIIPKLIILDDCAFDGSLKAHNNGIISRMFCNGRHIGLSVIVTAQKYSQVSTTARENASGLILFESSAKQRELISDDHAIVKKDFDRMFREATKEKHSFLCINYSNPIESRFMNSNFEPIN